MQPVSAAFLAAIKQSHVLVTKAEILRSGAPVQTLDILDGSVAVDVNNAVRRRCDVSLTDPTGTLTPAVATDLLAPFGNEVRLSRGIQFADGTSELIPLGVFGLEDVDVQDTADGLTIHLVGMDRAQKVARATLTDVYSVAAGTNFATAIQALIASRVSGLTYNFMITSNNTPALTFQSGDDPWKAAQDMAESMGAELFFDAQGICVLQPIPDPLVSAVAYSYLEGADATIVSVSKKLTRQGIYNYVVATGETSDPAIVPVRSVAQDSDPTSPTYTGGAFGVVVRFYASPFITTQAQADSAAAAMLRQSLGLTEQVGFTAIPNPAHEAGDVVTITRARAKVDARYVLDAFTVPLGPTALLQGTTRKRAT